MREIKFRAWDKVNKVMITSKHYSIMFNGEVHPSSNKHQEWEIDQFIPLQYIGLKDKKGKEICEGDIVRTPLYGQRDCEVVFMKCGFYLLLDTGIGTNLYEPSSVSMEIIGNIYETPELI